MALDDMKTFGGLTHCFMELARSRVKPTRLLMNVSLVVLVHRELARERPARLITASAFSISDTKSSGPRSGPKIRTPSPSKLVALVVFLTHVLIEWPWDCKCATTALPISPVDPVIKIWANVLFRLIEYWFWRPPVPFIEKHNESGHHHAPDKKRI